MTVCMRVYAVILFTFFPVEMSMAALEFGVDCSSR